MQDAKDVLNQDVKDKRMGHPLILYILVQMPNGRMQFAPTKRIKLRKKTWSA